MRIAVLGAGDMGAGIIEDLVNKAEVVALDINQERLNAISRKFGVETSKFNVLASNASDELRKGNYDAVASAIGPFYAFGELCLKVAIDAGIDFVDICDDYDATQKQLELNEKAKEKGVTAVIGCGWTPGISNMLVKYCGEKYEIESVEMDWVGSAADSEGLAVVMHVFHALTGKVPQFLNGRIAEVEAGSMEKTNDFPEIGKVKTVVCGHPEPITIPKYIQVKNAILRGALVPEGQNSLIKLFVKLGFTSTNYRKEKLSKTIHRIEGIFRTGGIKKSVIRVEVKDEEGRSFVYAAIDRMCRLTGYSASICAQMLASDEFENGVFPPEGILDSKDFLNEVIKRKIKFYTYEEGWKEIKSF
ncbi:MAG: saccharopine dehydrogenase NADP-binding domain-containing protein [Archaeoglobus sp.]|nr:saccharopine dehydrogenase NADP-binding domain-containing protein [Archaeoglobus sp.]